VTYSRRNGLVFLVTDATGAVWLTTPDEIQEEAANPYGWLGTASLLLSPPSITVYEVTGSGVVGPLKIERPGSWGRGQEKLMLIYPNGHMALEFDVSEEGQRAEASAGVTSA
jgi:hypothetical protein